MLQNRTYLGEIVHKGQSHPGEHAPIVDQPLWDAVHSQLADNTAERSSGTRTRQPSLLAGLLFDPDGNPMTPTHAVKKGTRYRYYVSRPLITKDQSERSAGLRIPAAEIEQLVTSRMRQWLLDPASIYQATRFSDASAQRRLLARAAEIGKIWPELPGARQRALVTALIERIDVGADQIDIRTRPTQLGAFLDGAATLSPSATDDETQTLCVPVRLRRSGREIRMLIDSTDPSAIAKPNARLIKLLIRAHRFHATLDRQPRRALCGTGQARRREPVLFHTAGPPQLSCPRHYESHPRRQSATPSHGRQAARPLTSAAGLARATRPARLCLRN